MEFIIVVSALFILFLAPALVWAVVIVGLYQLIREAVRERRAALDELHRRV